ncbi:MAG TPA: TadE family protein [Ilumatobacteraceae bacterium]
MDDRESRGASRRSRRTDEGQATVELALAMPLVCLLLLGIIQVALIVRDQVSAIDIARNRARAAAVAADPGGTGSDAGDVGDSEIDARTSVAGGYVTVDVTITNHTDVPLIGALLPDIAVHGRATMLLEPP